MFIHSLLYRSLNPVLHSLIRSLSRPLARLLDQSPTHSFIRKLVRFTAHGLTTSSMTLLIARALAARTAVITANDILSVARGMSSLAPFTPELPSLPMPLRAHADVDADGHDGSSSAGEAAVPLNPAFLL
jgi:hypothetical protein